MVCEAIKNCMVSRKDQRKTLVDSKGCKSQYLINNPTRNEYHEIDFENRVYQNRLNDTKCDYGVKTETDIFYIELKGSDVKKGVEQLLSTIRETRNCFQGITPKARLVVSRYPKPEIVRNTKEYKDLVKIVNHQPFKGNNLIITQNTFTENI